MSDIAEISNYTAPSLMILDEILRPALELALRYDDSKISFRMINLNTEIIDSKIIQIALDNAKISLLLYIW